MDPDVTTGHDNLDDEGPENPERADPFDMPAPPVLSVVPGPTPVERAAAQHPSAVSVAAAAPAGQISVGLGDNEGVSITINAAAGAIINIYRS